MTPKPPRLLSSDGHGFIMRSIDCPTCGPGAPKREVGFRGGRYHRYGLGVETRIVECCRCGLLFPDPFPFPENAQELYGDPEKYFGRDPEVKVEKYRGLIRSLCGTEEPSRMSLLDVGSGRGELLAAARREGLGRVVGLELSEAMIRFAREHYDVEVRPLLLEDFAASTGERFDIVVLNAVLEHVYDPDSMVRAARALLTDQGLLFIDVPNERHLLAAVAGEVNRILGRPAVLVLAPTFPPFHVFGFSPGSLRSLLSKHGLEVVHLRVRSGVHVPRRGGWKDRLASTIGSTIHRVGNQIGRGHNMQAWARPNTAATSGERPPIGVPSRDEARPQS